MSAAALRPYPQLLGRRGILQAWELLATYGAQASRRRRRALKGRPGDVSAEKRRDSGQLNIVRVYHNRSARHFGAAPAPVGVRSSSRKAQGWLRPAQHRNSYSGSHCDELKGPGRPAASAAMDAAFRKLQAEKAAERGEAAPKAEPREQRPAPEPRKDKPLMRKGHAARARRPTDTLTAPRPPRFKPR